MNKFLQNKLSNYFKTSKTPDLCMKYLRLNCPLNKVNLDHLAFRSIAIEDYRRIKNEILNNGRSFYHFHNDVVYVYVMF